MTWRTLSTSTWSLSLNYIWSPRITLWRSWTLMKNSGCLRMMPRHFLWPTTWSTIITSRSFQGVFSRLRGGSLLAQGALIGTTSSLKEFKRSSQYMPKPMDTPQSTSRRWSTRSSESSMESKSAGSLLRNAPNARFIRSMICLSSFS